MKHQMAIALLSCSLGILILSTYTFPWTTTGPIQNEIIKLPAIHNVTNKTDDMAVRNIYLQFHGEKEKSIFVRDIGDILQERANNIPSTQEEK